MSNSDGTIKRNTITTKSGTKTKYEIAAEVATKICDIRYYNGSNSPTGQRIGEIGGVETTVKRYILDMLNDIDVDKLTKDRDEWQAVAKAGEAALECISNNIKDSLRIARKEHSEGCMANMACSGTPCCCGVDPVES